MRPPRPHQLFDIRELAELAILDAALQILDVVLLHEHPMIEHPIDGDPRSLLAARRLLARARALRAELRRYRAAVLDAVAEIHDLPF